MSERSDMGERRGRRGARIGDTLGAMKERAREAGAQAGAASAAAQREVGRLGGQMREAAASLLDEQKERMASAVHGIADMLRRTADTLERENNATAARYADRAAAQIDRLSQTVRNRELGEIVASTEDFARRQPALFVAGAVAAGFVLGRLLARPSRREYAAGKALYRPSSSYRPSGDVMAGYGAASGIGGERL
jgi:ElaB/YqjD/DUF883 family membrane-anchored ribosome-binding protein